MCIVCVFCRYDKEIGPRWAGGKDVYALKGRASVGGGGGGGESGSSVAAGSSGGINNVQHQLANANAKDGLNGRSMAASTRNERRQLQHKSSYQSHGVLASQLQEHQSDDEHDGQTDQQPISLVEASK